MPPFPKVQVIGLCGFAFVGKDTVADLLATHAGFRKIAFADALRGELCDAFHVDPSTFSDRARKQTPMPELAFSRCLDRGYVGAAWAYLVQQLPAGTLLSDELTKPRTPRETLQLWGTQYRRASDPLYWIRKVHRSVVYFARELHERHFVITDVRYDNEANLVRSLGGELWQVTRPGCGGELEGNHSSATDGADFHPDRILANVDGIRHLQALVLGEHCALTYQLPGCTLEIHPA